ncbi:hypothetical protein DV737_g3252, partial [Chaetothyriales sp. CBS 132003]
MASEIADSDAESDMVDAQGAAREHRGHDSLAADDTALANHISPPPVDFDDPLGPTQILSDQSLPGEGWLGRGTGSTEKRLQRAGREQQNEAASSMDIDADLLHSAAEAVSLPVDQVGANDTSNHQAVASHHARDTSPPMQTVNLQPNHAAARAGALDGLGRAVHLLGNTSTSATAGYAAKTLSSYGGYQSIELDFRDGLDYDVNPFGDMTQASVDGAAAGDTAGHVQQAMMAPNTSEERVHAQALPSPSVQLHNSRLECPLEPQSKAGKTDGFSRATTASPAPSFRRATSASAEPVSNLSDNPQPKKRARTAAKSKLTGSVGPDGMARPDPPTSARSRPGTLDSSQPSHEETPSNTKRKRRRSGADAKADEASASRQLTSELHPDEEEELIGLPKENYRPRPSRRRSKPLSVQGPADPDSSVALLEHSPEPRPPSAKSSKSCKKTRKSKVKRAKTSAAALLKKSCQMISDGEDDVIWVDDKPAAVKLELPPDLKRLKKEADTEAKLDAGARILPQKATVCVEIPVPAAAMQEKPIEAATSQADRSKPAWAPSDPALDKAPTPEPLSDAEGGRTEKQQTDENAEADDEPTGARNWRLALASMNAKTPSLIVPASSSHPKMPRGPTSHSPIAPASAWNSQSRFRVGLSKRQSIPSLLRKVDKTKAAPTKVGVRVKERKVTARGGDDDDDGDGSGQGVILRDKDGNLVEWEF